MCVYVCVCVCVLALAAKRKPHDSNLFESLTFGGVLSLVLGEGKGECGSWFQENDYRS